MELFGCWILGLSLIVGALGLDEPVITISQGKLRGKVSESRGGTKYLEFLGIPFAGKPKRFQLAGNPPKWDGTRDSTRFRDKCLQMNRRTKSVEGSEDCLYLNVYTRVYSEPSHARLPVMVWIHGGGFVSGSGNDYNPKYFMDENVIIVTINYRLGSFGFLTTLNKNLIPNLGMKDQVAALKWVKANIKHFGGDDQKITIFGTSAGAASVSYHLLSTMSEGLFHRAISQSGNSLCPWALSRNPNEVAIRLGKLMNCSTANTFTIAACLKQADGREIIIKQQKLTGWNPQSVSFSPFAPVVELIHHSIETGPIFLHESPKTLLREGRFKNIPWLTGVNSADGVTLSAAAVFSNSTLLKQVNSNWQQLAPLAFSYKDMAPNPQSISQKLREFYFGANGGVIDESAKGNFTNALSDRNFFRCAKHCALLYAKHSMVWMYYFTFRSNYSVLRSFGMDDNLGIDGVVHLDELQYLFKMDIFPEIGRNSPFHEFSYSLVKLWTSFASEGRPSSLWSNALRWNPVPAKQISSTSPMQMYKLSDSTAIIEEPFYHRLAFWDKLRLLPPSPTTGTSTSQSKNLAPDLDNKESSTICVQDNAKLLLLSLLTLVCIFYS